MKTFSEHLANLAAVDALKVGDKIRIPLSGRTGTIVDKGKKHTGWRIRWDEPVFGVTESRINPSSMEPLS